MTKVDAAQAVAQEVKSNVITLSGSAEIICDFMEFGINMILFQRDIYPNEDFKQVQKYGRPLYLTENEKLKEYLKNILTGLKVMLEKDECHKVVLVIINVESEEPVERWEFEVKPDHENSTKVENNAENIDPHARYSNMELKKIQAQIVKIMQQIIGSVTYLPIRDDEHTFNILLYTRRRSETPIMHQWSETTAHTIEKTGNDNVEVIDFQTLTTGVHNVKSKVCYKVKN